MGQRQVHQVRDVLAVLSGGVHQGDPEGYYAADMDYCKGCGICAHECWPEAIAMKEEEEG